jgi:hypothetical protein
MPFSATFYQIRILITRDAGASQKAPASLVSYSAFPGIREEFGEVCCAIIRKLTGCFSLKYPWSPLPGSFFERCITNDFRRNSAGIFVS